MTITLIFFFFFAIFFSKDALSKKCHDRLNYLHSVRVVSFVCFFLVEVSGLLPTSVWLSGWIDNKHCAGSWCCCSTHAHVPQRRLLWKAAGTGWSLQAGSHGFRKGQAGSETGWTRRGTWKTQRWSVWGCIWDIVYKSILTLSEVALNELQQLLQAVRCVTVVDLSYVLLNSSPLLFSSRVQPIPTLVDPRIPTCPWRRTRRRLGVKPSARLSCSWREPRWELERSKVSAWL